MSAAKARIRGRIRFFALAGAALVALAAAVPALAATVFVSVVDNAFQPPAVTARQGDTVQWDWDGFGLHTVTDATGMGLYDSGTRSNGATFTYTYDAAGRYAYICQIHQPSMDGTVSVPIKAKPRRGNPGTTFTITWSTTDAEAGFVFDVQIKRPGGEFVDWLPSQTVRKAEFVPDSGRGRYSFRSRLRKTSNDMASEYSPAKTIRVR